MEVHLFGRKAGDLNRDLIRHGLHLGGRPDVAPVFADVDHAIRRFHGRMRKVGHLVNGFHRFRSTCDGSRRIAHFAGGNARLQRLFGQHFADTGGAELRVGAVFELQVERLHAFKSGPGVVGNYSDTRGDSDEVFHAGNRFGFGCVEGDHLAAHYRRPRHRGINHAGNANVDAEAGFAGHFIARIQALHRFADVTEFRGVLELWPRGRLQLRGILRQFAIGKFSA